MVSLSKTVRSHYHWVIATVVFMQMIVFGGMVNSYSLYVIPVTEGLNVSRGLYSLLSVGCSLMIVFSTMTTTKLFHKYGYRKVVCFSLALLSFSMVMAAFSKNIWLYSFARLFFGIGYGACHTAGAAWIVRAWFHKHNGLMLGIITMATGLGGSVYSLFLAEVIEKLDWRWGHGISGGLLLVTMLLMLLFVRDMPDLLGLKPYGDGENDKNRGKKKSRNEDWPGVSVEQTKRSPAYWLLTVVFFAVYTCVSMATTVFAPHFQDNGFSAIDAAKYQSLLMLMVAVAKLVCGLVYDRIGGKALGVICIVFAAIGQWCLAYVSDPTLAYIYVIIFSIGTTMTTVAIPLITSSIFGTETSASIMGAVLGIASFGGVISQPAINLLYDAIGSYGPIFRVAALLNIAMVVLLLIICWMFGKKEREYRKNIGM